MYFKFLGNMIVLQDLKNIKLLNWDHLIKDPNVPMNLTHSEQLSLVWWIGNG